MQSAFLRNVAMLASGKGAALIIALLLTPVISRLFTPADFGVVALLIALGNFLGDVSTLNYHLTIVLPKTARESAVLVSLSKSVLLALCSLLLLVMLCFELMGLALPFSATLGPWIWAVPPLMLIIGLTHIRAGALTRCKEFLPITQSDVAQALGTTGSRITLGALFGSSVWGLASGYLIGLATKLLLLRSRKEAYKELNKLSPSRGEQIRAARQYRDFPFFSVPSTLLSSVSSKLPIFMLGLWLGPAVVGLYAMAERLVRGPVDAVGIALRRVYLQRTAELQASGQSVGGIYRKTTLILVVAGIAPFGLLWLYGEEIIAFLLGEAWRDAGRYTEILTPWFFAMWAGGIVAPTLTVKRKQKLWLRLQLVVLIARAASLCWCLMMEESAEFTLSLFVGVNVLLVMMLVVVGLSISSSEEGGSERGMGDGN